MTDDLVSRMAVLKLVADYDLSMGQVVIGIHALPSVNPQEPKTGHWYYDEERGATGIYAICSNCDEEIYQTGDFKYCPNCGAKMQ